LLVLNAAWVGISFLWNSLHVIILPAVLLNFVPESQKNTYLGLLTFTGLVIAAIVQPAAGALSDRTTSRWGHRRPWIALGTAADFVFLALLGWAGGLPWLLAGYLGLQVTSNLAHGPLQGLLPDRVPRDQLGVASGVKNLCDMGALVVAALLVGRLMPPASQPPVLPVALVGLVLAGSTAITVFGVREARLPAQASSGSGNRPWWDSLRVDWRAEPRYAWLIASRFAFLLGIYGIQAFAQYYVRDVLAAPNPAQVTGDLLAAITLALVAFTVSGGWLCDRFGRRRLQVIASVISAVGCLLLLAARTPGLLLGFGAVLGAGIGLFLTANWALATELAPEAEAGKFLGLTNLATAGSGALGRLQGPAIDALNAAAPGAWWGYAELFVFGAVCVLVSAWLLRRVR
jgi:Na+/melibiose symporter-like transporter